MELGDRPLAVGPLVDRLSRLGDSVLARVPEAQWRYGLPLIYLLLVLPRLASHAFWFDEAQAWLIARESTSLPNLLVNLRFEGHPPLWYLFLWPFAHLSSDPEWMKVPTSLLTIALALMVPRIRSLARGEQVLLLGGFTSLVGYTTISRSYILGIALIVGYLLRAQRGGSLRGDLLLISLLLLTHALFAPAAFVLFATSLVRHRSELLTWPNRLMVAAVPVIGLWTASLLVSPDSIGVARIDGDWTSLLQPASYLRPLFNAFLPLGEFSGILPLLGSIGPGPLMALVAALTALFLRTLVARAKWLGLGTALSLAVLLINAVVGYGSEWWHLGPITWMLAAGAVLGREGLEPEVSPRMQATQSASLRCLLALPVCASAFWLTSPAADVPYSAERQVAEIVRRACPSGCPVVADSWGTVVSAYLGGAPIYHLREAAWRTFQPLDATINRSRPVTWEGVREQLKRLGPDAVAYFWGLPNPPPDFTILGTTTRGFMTQEFIVVRLLPEPAPSTP